MGYPAFSEIVEDEKFNNMPERDRNRVVAYWMQQVNNDGRATFGDEWNPALFTERFKKRYPEYFRQFEVVEEPPIQRPVFDETGLPTPADVRPPPGIAVHEPAPAMEHPATPPPLRTATPAVNAADLPEFNIVPPPSTPAPATPREAIERPVFDETGVPPITAPAADVSKGVVPQEPLSPEMEVAQRLSPRQGVLSMADNVMDLARTAVQSAREKKLISSSGTVTKKLDQADQIISLIKEGIKDELTERGIAKRMEEDAEKDFFHPHNIATMISTSASYMSLAVLGEILGGTIGSMSVLTPLLAGATISELEQESPDMSADEKLARAFVSAVPQAALERIVPSKVLKGGRYMDIKMFLENVGLEAATEAGQRAIELISIHFEPELKDTYNKTKLDAIRQVALILSNPKNVFDIMVNAFGGAVGGAAFQLPAASRREFLRLLLKEVNHRVKDANIPIPPPLPPPVETTQEKETAGKEIEEDLQSDKAETLPEPPPVPELPPTAKEAEPEALPEPTQEPTQPAASAPEPQEQLALPPPRPTFEDLKQMTSRQLRIAAKGFGINTSGNKSELLERINEHLDKEGAPGRGAQTPTDVEERTRGTPVSGEETGRRGVGRPPETQAGGRPVEGTDQNRQELKESSDAETVRSDTGQSEEKGTERPAVEKPRRKNVQRTKEAGSETGDEKKRLERKRLQKRHASLLKAVEDTRKSEEDLNKETIASITRGDPEKTRFAILKKQKAAYENRKEAERSLDRFQKKYSGLDFIEPTERVSPTKTDKQKAMEAKTLAQKIKVQKEFLLDAIDKVINDGDLARQEDVTTDDIIYGQDIKRSRMIKKRNPDAPHVVFEVPEDGTFAILKTKEALETFRRLVKRNLSAAKLKPEKSKLPSLKAAVARLRNQPGLSVDEIQSGTEKGGNTVSDSRIDAKDSGQASIFEMEEGDLIDFFNERFGDPGKGKVSLGAGRRRGEYEFENFDDFSKYMDARYNERDLEGMKLAFAAAPNEQKAKYVRRKGAPKHWKSWILHIATGSPLPADDGPVARTTPRPIPNPRKKRKAALKTAPQTGDKPPPPRPGNKLKSMNITGLVQFIRRMSKKPTVNARLRRVYGRYLQGQNIELKPRLLYDKKLATRVLAHEIGHLVDIALDPSGFNKQFAERIAPLRDFKNNLAESKALRNVARALSAEWRGPFSKGDAYRDTGSELFADFMSAMLTDPEWVNLNFGALYDAFEEFRAAKPKFEDAYTAIQKWIKDDSISKKIQQQIYNSVKKTWDVLTSERTRAKARKRDLLMQNLVTLWQRSHEKSGKPKELGNRIIDKLDNSIFFAEMKAALWYDDFVKTVQIHLDKFDDQLSARAHLMSFTVASRVINEDRLAGQWVKKNPVKAREFLEKLFGVLNMPERLSALPDVADADLYAFAAQAFFDVHNRGKRFVERAIRRIDNIFTKMDVDLSARAAMVMFDVRGNLLNPYGLTPGTAQDLLDDLRSQVGKDKYESISKAAAALHALLFQVQEEMYEAGLISKENWENIIKPNRNSYVPFAVLDYFDGFVRPGLLSQQGTAGDIADIVAVTELKIASSFVWLQKQYQVRLNQEAWESGGIKVEPGRELKTGELEKIRKQHLDDDVSRTTLWVDGKPRLMEFPADRGKLLERALSMREFLQHHGEWAMLSRATHGLMEFFTKWNPRFIIWRNTSRGVRTGVTRVGAGVLKQYSPQTLRFAQNYAASAFGEPMLDEVRAMVASQALPPPHIAAGMVKDLGDLREQLINGSLPAFQAQRLVPKVKPSREVVRRMSVTTDEFFTIYEGFEKIVSFREMIDRGEGIPRAAAVSARAGIALPGVGGRYSFIMEVFVPWLRIHTQGIRSGLDILRDPKLGKGFAARWALLEGVPILAKVAVGAGLAANVWKFVTDDEDDPEDNKWAEIMQRISPYKMALDQSVPLWFWDPIDGKIHYFSEFRKGSEILKHYEVVSLRLPVSEDGLTYGTFLYNLLISNKYANEKLGQGGKGPLTNMHQWISNDLLPGFNPAFKTGANFLKMLSGENPKDSFTGGPAANPVLFEAGGKDRFDAIAGYLLKSAGGPGELAGVIAANLGIMDKRAVRTFTSRLPDSRDPWYRKIPYLDTVISHDNYKPYREEENTERLKKVVRARAKLVMSEEVYKLYSFYWANKNNQDRLSREQKKIYKNASRFVNRIWGKIDDPHSWHAKAAHAVTDGSRESKKEIQRQLDRIVLSRGYLYNFEDKD